MNDSSSLDSIRLFRLEEKVIFANLFYEFFLAMSLNKDNIEHEDEKSIERIQSESEAKLFIWKYKLILHEKSNLNN